MPDYLKINSVELVDTLLANINYPYSVDHYSSAVWADDANFVLGYLHIKGHVVTVSIRHRHNEKAIFGQRVAEIEINQILASCSIFAEVSELNGLAPEDFIKYISREIVALGDPVEMEGEKLIAV